MIFKLEEFLVAVVHFQPFVDSIHRGVVERHLQCAQRPYILLNLLLHLATVGTLRRTSEAEINKELQLLFAKHYH